MKSLSTVRYEVLTDDSLPSDTKRVLSDILTEKIGYPPPEGLLEEDNQDDEDSPLADDIEDVKDYNFLEVWRKGAKYSRSKLEWKGVTFHHTAGTLAGTIHWLTKAGKVSASYHVIIDEDGTRYRLVDDQFRAYHAGYGKLHGENPNHTTLSIAFIGDTTTGKFRKTRKLNKFEIESCLEFLEPRWNRLTGGYDWITDHRTTDPNRRNDLSPDVLSQIKKYLKLKFGNEQ